MPAGTPEPILPRLGAELLAMLAKPQVRVALSNAGEDAAPGTRDATVAGGIALDVLQPDIVNVAGVAPIMLRMAGGEVWTIAGLGP